MLVAQRLIIDSIKRYPDKLLGFACVQPLDAKDAQELARCLDAGLMGLGELGPDGQRFDIEDKRILQASAEVLEQYDRPLLTHASEPMGHSYPGKGQTLPWKLLKLAQNFPDVKMVFAHWGGGLPFYELMPEVGEHLRNVYYDTAASTYLYRFDVFPVAAQLLAQIEFCGARIILCCPRARCSGAFVRVACRRTSWTPSWAVMRRASYGSKTGSNCPRRRMS